jgi:glutathione S-transferase
VRVFDCNAILLYLVEKTGRFLSENTPNARGHLPSWLMFVATGIRPALSYLKDHQSRLLYSIFGYRRSPCQRFCFQRDDASNLNQRILGVKR